MVRKQLYISEEQERALKQQAQERSLSEAEIIREALDKALGIKNPEEEMAYREQLIQTLLDEAKQLAKTHRPPEGYKFNREEIYEERMARWFKEDKEK